MSDKPYRSMESPDIGTQSNTGYIWLAYSVFFFIDPILSHSRRLWVESGVIYAIFLLIYVGYMKARTLSAATLACCCLLRSRPGEPSIQRRRHQLLHLQRSVSSVHRCFSPDPCHRPRSHRQPVFCWKACCCISITSLSS